MHWNKAWFQFLILLLLAFIWGSSFILMKIGLKSFSSEQAAGIRMLLASLVLLPYSIKNLKFLKKKDLKSLLIAGFIGSFIPAFLFTKAQTQIDSALAGMLNSLTPIFTLAIGILLHKTKFKWLQVTGLVIGLIGALGLITSGKELALGNVNSYALLIVLATVFYGININEIKSKLSHLTGIQITSLAFFFTGPAALIYLATTDFEPVLQSPNWPVHFLALAALGIIGTALAMLLMNSLIRYSSAIYASSVTYIIPIFAIFWGVIDGETITILHLTCMACILLGVYLTNKRKKVQTSTQNAI
ncbi:DMT family transporter [Labilibaculum euxinus]|uniref:EamA family transporter n=1 Tax=Labilibaculum euxinus TaxID=2686357 RepID=A0A7M4D700_9BACT|nr:DMT family transporter [Labilibaculum euxinus]MUP38429.1 EamA family transporter [Labilibaculum euxinus]MVB07634.1 EamA family transporter [Labilibaculum euxinus]